MLVAPWITWSICFVVPGYREEPWVLSLNLWLAMVSIMFWMGYMAYATNMGGWRIIKHGDFLLLIMPLYYLISSVWVAKQRIPLARVPAFRTLQGAAMMTGAFLILSWFLGRIRIVLFSYLPFSSVLWLLALALTLGYIGYRRIVD